MNRLKEYVYYAKSAYPKDSCLPYPLVGAGSENEHGNCG